MRAPSARPAPEIQATRPQPTESGTKSAKPKAKRTRKTQTGAEKPNLNEKLRDLLGKKRDQAENHSRRTRVLEAVPRGAARSVGAEHERKRSAGAGPKSELPEGLKCKISGRRKNGDGGEERSVRGRAGFYRRAAGRGGLGATQLRGDVFAAGDPESRSICTPTEAAALGGRRDGEPAPTSQKRFALWWRWLAVFVFSDRHGQVL